MNLPVEIIENILSFCDGETLKTAKEVNSTWNSIVEFLTEKTPIWKRCCLEDIPKKELVNYTEKYETPADPNKWINIYNNWYAWKNIKDNVLFDIVHCPVEVPRITYVAVSGTYIAVGSEDGRVRIFEESWGLLHTARYQAVKITEITFMNDEENGRLNLLIAYRIGTLVVAEFDGKLNELVVIQDVKLHSVYKKYLCYEKRGGRITICKICQDMNGTQNVIEITFLRIYSPSEVSCLHLWGGVATFLINNEVKVLKYDENVAPASYVENKLNINFCLKNQPSVDHSYHIYRDDIIICASTCDKLNEQLIELFLMGEKNQYSKKIFNSSEIFCASITCMFLYGNIFILGIDTGNIYFYYVPYWNRFSLRNYQKKVIIGRHPIIGIDVKEYEKERKFYVTSSFNVHEVTCFIP